MIMDLLLINREYFFYAILSSKQKMCHFFLKYFDRIIDLKLSRICTVVFARLTDGKCFLKYYINKTSPFPRSSSSKNGYFFFLPGLVSFIYFIFY